MNCRVIKRHTGEFPDPIVISQGDKLAAGEKYQGPEDWNNWYFRETRARTGGRAPGQLVQWPGHGEGEALEDYSAEEMNVGAGETGEAGDRFNRAQRLDMEPPSVFPARGLDTR